MKRLVANKKYTIEVFIELEYVYGENADLTTANYIHKLTNIKKKNQATDEMINVLNHVIDETVKNINAHNFRIKSKGDNPGYQSKKGYSYYINFFAPDINNEMCEIEVIFRISDHPQKHGVNEAPKDIVFKSFFVGNIYLSNPEALVAHINKILDEIAIGNFAIIEH